MHFFEDMKIGERRELGSFAFTADAIKTFAVKFDPQRFHLDEETDIQLTTIWAPGSLVIPAVLTAPENERGE